MARLDAETVSGIQANAALVIEMMQKLSDIAFGYDEASVEWLDGYINRVRTKIGQDTVEGLVMNLACYLGEAIIRSYGGAWDDEGGEIGVRFSQGNGVYPFSKLQKQFANGEEDSISSFFTLIPIIFAGKIKPSA